MEWAEGDFSTENVDKAERGTEIILHLRDDEDEFLNDWRLRSIIRKYSGSHQLPIMMRSKRPVTMPMASHNRPVTRWEPVNRASAPWTRSKTNISPGAVWRILQTCRTRFLRPAGPDPCAG